MPSMPFPPHSVFVLERHPKALSGFDPSFSAELVVWSRDWCLMVAVDVELPW
jgi:hypothetical protein